MALARNAIHQGDCIKLMDKMDAGSVDLSFADPPFNIGYKYDVYDDRQTYDDYLSWSRDWISGVHRILKDDGTFWLAIGDEFAAELKLAAQDIGFHTRSWVIWYYTFGVNCTNKFTRSHAHMFYFVKDPAAFTFNADDPKIRIPSARQLVYGDKRANPKGRLPDDTWIYRPQDVPDGFQPSDDTWFFSRVAGTFSERQGFHGCQMPEQLLGRIIRACSSEGETVFDPFGGSGTTLAVAKKLNRQFLGTEMSRDYVKQIRERLKACKNGDSLDGPEDPVSSAPKTANGRRLSGVSANGSKNGNARRRSTIRLGTAPTTSKEEYASPVDREKQLRKDISRLTDYDDVLVQAYRKAAEGFSLDRMLADPELLHAFCEECRASNVPMTLAHWNRRLVRIRKAGKLPKCDRGKSKPIRAQEIDPYEFASEIAMARLARDGASLDDVLCDPMWSRKFDEIARTYAPGFSEFDYRWAALQVRKRAKGARDAMKRVGLSLKRSVTRDHLRITKRSRSRLAELQSRESVYWFGNIAEKTMYVGHTYDSHDRLIRHFDSGEKSFCVFPLSKNSSGVGLQSWLIKKYRPECNFHLLAS